MGMIISILAIILILLIVVAVLLYTEYDQRGFKRNGIHKNGTEYDDFGYDVDGYDQNGYDCFGYDVNGYNRNGYNKVGYNRDGKNAKGQYNRFYDVHYSKDGFYNPKHFPIIVTNHAKERMVERKVIRNLGDAEKQALDAYCYGRSKRQIKRSSAALIQEIENRYDHSVLLVYRGYIYIFSDDNKLITVYKNDRISL